MNDEARRHLQEVLETRAQRDGEKALEDLIEAEYDGDACACHTCIVRVVLEAAWPHLEELAIHTSQGKKE